MKSFLVLTIQEETDTRFTLKILCISNILSKNNPVAVISSGLINYLRKIRFFLTAFLEIFFVIHTSKSAEYEERWKCIEHINKNLVQFEQYNSIQISWFMVHSFEVRHFSISSSDAFFSFSACLHISDHDGWNVG